MKHRTRVALSLGLGLILILTSLSATAATPKPVKTRADLHFEHATAIAALNAVGLEDGWGRAVVSDADPPSGTTRSVSVSLHGLTPRTDYTITIEGVDVGTVRTSTGGSAQLKLKNSGRGFDPVPEELPGADQLESVTVFDNSLAAVLVGSFTAIVHCPGETVYEEEIELDDVAGGDAEGVAEVEMRDSGYQGFKTLATGLIPGSVYRVTVDGLDVALETADAEGQARVCLEHPSEDDPLPDALKPVSEIREVTWTGPDGAVQLMGSFTGEGEQDCRELEGEVITITDLGFVFAFGSDEITVEVTPETRWIDSRDHDLQVGDLVEVEGCFVEGVLVAERIKLLKEEHDCERLEGVVVRVETGRFLLEVGDDVVPVIISDRTEFIRFGDQELAAGNVVLVSGCFDEDAFFADWIKLLDDSADCDDMEGAVLQLTETGFILQTSSRFGADTQDGVSAQIAPYKRIQVVVTPETQWLDFEDHELEVGDIIELEACQDGEIWVAAWIRLVEHEEDCDDIEGTVTRITDAGFELQTIGGHSISISAASTAQTAPFRTIPVVVTPNTQWIDFGEHELAVGDQVQLEGCWDEDEDVFIAVWVKLLDDEEDCGWKAGYVTEITETGFRLRVIDGSAAGLRAMTMPQGTTNIIVTPETQWIDFEDEQLEVGDKVKVEGCWDGDSLVADAVILLDDEEECGWAIGYVTEITETGFALRVIQASADGIRASTMPHPSLPIVVTPNTQWLEFGDHELTVGDKVKAEGCFDGESLVAEWVKLLEAEEECGWRIGEVLEITDRGFKLQVHESSQSELRAATQPHTYVWVATTPNTQWLEFGDHALTVGDEIKVEGCWDGETLVAEWVKLLEAADECCEFEGRVTEIGDGGFTVETLLTHATRAQITAAGDPACEIVNVTVTPNTLWVDFGDHELGVGDIIAVEGCWDGDLFIAVWVRLIHVAPDCATVEGEVTAIGVDEFALATGAGTVVVEFNEETDWLGFEEHDLVVGDIVKVEGCWREDILVADCVKLLEVSQDCARFEGTVTSIGVDEFGLMVGSEQIIVEVTPNTQWLNFGDHEFSVDDTVVVEGCWDGDLFFANIVKLLDFPEPCVELEGEVTAIGVDEFLLRVQGETVVVEFNPNTQWLDFGDHSLSVGDIVLVEGCWEDDLLVAIWVKLLEAQQGCTSLEGPVAILTEYGFTLQLGAEIIPVEVTPNTVWLEFGDHQLTVGDVVEAEGCWEGEVLIASSVTLLQAVN